MRDHERALVDLCSGDGSSDDEVEQCVLDFLTQGYDAGSPGSDVGNEEECSLEEDGVDCLLDGMHSMWAEDMAVLPVPPVSNGAQDGEDPLSNQNSKPKPWSSRSSPSGTFVRDPVTGEMKNIDAQ